jgi:hypothetical protein
MAKALIKSPVKPLAKTLTPEELDAYLETTDEDFDYFKQCCLEYQIKFGLQSWEVLFVWSDLSKDGYNAQINWSTGSSTATVTFSTKWTRLVYLGRNTRDTIRMVARHEMFHLLIARLNDIAGRRYVQMVDVDEAAEQLVIIIENVYQMGKQAEEIANNIK